MRTIDLQHIQTESSLRFFWAEVHDIFATVFYSLGGPPLPLGLRLDLGKQVFLDYVGRDMPDNELRRLAPTVCKEIRKSLEGQEKHAIFWRMFNKLIQ